MERACLETANLPICAFSVEVFFKSECPACGGHVEYPAELAGTAANCPHCNRAFILPAHKPPPIIVAPRREDFENPMVAAARDAQSSHPMKWVAVAAVIILLLLGVIAVSAGLLKASDAVLLTLGLGLYFLPTLVAGMRGHRNQDAICVLNLLLGWTFIGWVIALVWACLADRK